MTPRETQDELLAAFEAALAGEGTQRLAPLLATDIQLAADSGGRVVAIRKPLRGKDDVLSFIAGLGDFWRNYALERTFLNGGRGLLLHERGAVVGAISFCYDESGKAVGIYIMRNPDKLARFGARRTDDALRG